LVCSIGTYSTSSFIPMVYPIANVTSKTITYSYTVIGT
jgi:hypothetical protein